MFDHVVHFFSDSVSQLKPFKQEGAAAEGIQKPESLNRQNAGNRTSCQDHFTARGYCQEHLDEHGSQLCSSLVALQKTFWQTPYRGPDAENDADGSWKSCTEQDSGRGAARCMLTLLSAQKKKKLITFKEMFGLFYFKVLKLFILCNLLA